MAAPSPSTIRSPAEPVRSGLVDVIKWLLTSAGLSGRFVASGYVVKTAYQKFLGTEFPDLTTSDYVVSAGGFLLDSIASVYSAIASHILPISAIAALFAILATVWWKLHRGRAHGNR